MEKGMDQQLNLKFLMFENETNICWLDASIALIAHNRTFKNIVESSPESQINKIISTYEDAIATFNIDCEQKLKTPEMLKAIQDSTLKYLKQFLKFKAGEPDSAFCALLNLIYQDKSDIKECLNVSWNWRKRCSRCGTNSKSAICKPIITLSKVNAFHPECPSSVYMCSCKSEQEMRLIYKELPSCLIFHFEKGIGTGTSIPLSFSIKNREYLLTSIVILEKSSTDLNVNHFVTWIRNPFCNMWLECNDLNPGFAQFSLVKPEFSLKDIYMSVFEAFDDLGRINNEITTDQEQDVENANVELIDLSDEENDTLNIDSCSKTSTSEFSNRMDEISNISKNSFPDVGTFKKEMLTDDKKDFIKAKDFGNKATDNIEHKASESSDANEKETVSCLSVTNETSTIEKLEMYNNEKPKESEKDCRTSYQKISIGNFNLPNKLSVNKCKTEVQFDEAVVKSFEAKKFKAKATDYAEHKITEASDGNKKKNCSSPTNKNTSTIKNSSMHKNEKIKKSKKTCNIIHQNISISARRFSNESSDKHEGETKSKNYNYLDKPVCESVKSKEFIAEATKNPVPKVTDVSFRNKKEKKKNSFDHDDIVENITTDDTTHKESSLTRCEFVDETSDETNKYNKKKSQIKMKQVPLKKTVILNNNENKYSRLNEKKRARTEDKYASPNKRIKETSDGKYVSPNKEKNVVIKNDQTASTSVADDELEKNTSRRSKPSKSDSARKKTKISNIDNTDEKPSNKSLPNKISSEKIKKVVDSVVTRTFAAFFERIIEIRDANKRTPDSTT